jgi:hypothetical protein
VWKFREIILFVGSDGLCYWPGLSASTPDGLRALIVAH